MRSKKTPTQVSIASSQPDDRLAFTAGSMQPKNTQCRRNDSVTRDPATTSP